MTDSEMEASGGDGSMDATLGVRLRAEARCARLLMALGQGFPVGDDRGAERTRMA